MKLSELKIAKGSVHPQKRVGLGLGSGMGKTSTRGQKGAGARSGAQTRQGFEGGQNPIYRRLPKRGFKNQDKVVYTAINLGQIQGAAEAEGLKDGADFEARAYVSNRDLARGGVKILGDGELSVKLNVIADKFSSKAQAAIEKAGGKCTLYAD